MNPKLRAKTARDYSAHLRRYALPRLGHLRLNAIRPLDLQDAIAELIRQKLSPRTVRYTHSILHSALEQAVKWDLIDKNPAAYTVLPRPESADVATLTPEQAVRFAATCERHEFGPIFLLAISTGLRPSEYLALQVKDIRFSESKLTVERTVERHKGRWLFREAMRPRSRRTVSLPAETMERLEAYCRAHGKLDEPERLLFEAKRRTPIHELESRAAGLQTAPESGGSAKMFACTICAIASRRCRSPPACRSAGCPNNWGTRASRSPWKYMVTVFATRGTRRRTGWAEFYLIAKRGSRQR